MLIRPVGDDGIISWEIRLDVLIMSDYEVSIWESTTFIRDYNLLGLVNSKQVVKETHTLMISSFYIIFESLINYKKREWNEMDYSEISVYRFGLTFFFFLISY